MGTGAGLQISECIRSKGAEEKVSLLLKGNFVCLPKWQEIQSNFRNWTEPKWPWKTNNWRRDKDVWSRQACHKSGERVAVVVATETTCEGIFSREPQTYVQSYNLSQVHDPFKDPAHPHHD